MSLAPTNEESGMAQGSKITFVGKKNFVKSCYDIFVCVSFVITNNKLKSFVESGEVNKYLF